MRLRQAVVLPVCLLSLSVFFFPAICVISFLLFPHFSCHSQERQGGLRRSNERKTRERKAAARVTEEKTVKE